MNVATMSMPRDKAVAAYHEYRQAVRENPDSKRDQIIMMGYRAMARGRSLMNVDDVLRAAGLDERGRPKLALARADWRFCWFIWNYYGSKFQKERLIDGRSARAKGHGMRIALPHPPLWRFPVDANGRRRDVESRAVVPMIPPRLRPAGSLERYHILWEAAWEEMPTDPILLRHIEGPLYVVLGMWDLTPLERSVLGSTVHGQ